MSNLPYEGATPEQLSSPLVREFLMIHDMFRQRLAAILGFIEELMSGEQSLESSETQRQIQVLIQVGTQYTQILHMHHHAETDMVFPLLEKDGLDRAVIERLNADHDEIGVMIDEFSLAIRQLATIDPDVLNHDLRRLADALHAHLAYEETHVCPFFARWKHWPPLHF